MATKTYNSNDMITKVTGTSCFVGIIRKRQTTVIFGLCWLLLTPSLCVQSVEQRLLLKNASVVMTMDSSIGEGELGLIENADVLIVGSHIAKVGQDIQDVSARKVDLTGRIVLPGFVDAHNHLWNSMLRGCGSGGDLYWWLNHCQYPLLEDPVSVETVYEGVRLSTFDLINTGVTTTLDWMGGPSPEFADNNLRALEDAGIRFVYSAFRHVADKAAMQDLEIIRRRLDNNPLGTLQVGPFLINEEPFRSGFFVLTDFAKKHKLRIHVHLRENAGDKEFGQLAMLREADVLGPRLQVAHAIHLDDAELEEFAEAGVRAIHNPLSNMRLGSGIMRLHEMLEAGIPVALGLDGGTNDTSDMFNTMRIAVGLQRAKLRRTDIRPTITEVLRMATIDGAGVLGLEQQVGSLTPGKQADIIALNPDMVNFAPRFDWVSQIVLNAQPVNVDWVFVAGQPLKRNGELVGDVDNIIAQANRDAAVLKKIIDKAVADQATEKNL